MYSKRCPLLPVAVREVEVEAVLAPARVVPVLAPVQVGVVDPILKP